MGFSSTKSRRPARTGAGIIAVLLLAVTGLLGLVAGAYATVYAEAGTAGQPTDLTAFTAAAQATATVELPLAQRTFVSPPMPAPTGNVPLPQVTGGTDAPITPGPNDQAPGLPTASPTPLATGTTSSNSLPLIIGGLLLLGVLAGAAFLFMRRGTPATAPPAPPAAPPVDTGATTPLPVTPPVAIAGGTPPPPAAATERTTALPTMVKCPNCDTMNPIDRRYCDECGQDLRTAVAAALAGPLPEVEATTPYLETLSRVDEQLEFVLARDLITIGRALDNDIVIDDQFIGWQTVSPRHAELRRSAEGFRLRDLNSENGTFVNSARTGENLLQDGMSLAFGKVEFIYRVPTE